MHRFSPFPILLLLFAATAGSASAAPGDFNPSETSAKATWFVHLNVANLRASEIGRQMIGELDGEAKRQLRQFERMLSFHPIDDLESVTFYGTSNDPEKAVALIRGKFDAGRLTGVAEDAEDYQPVAHGKAVIHSWKDGNKRVYAAIASDRLVMISPQLELVRTALDVTSGAGAAIEEAKIFGHTTGGDPAILTASADLSALGALEIDSSLVRKIDSLYLSAGEKGGELFAHAALKTADQRSAKLVDQMLHGVLALAEASDEVPAEVIEAFKTQLGGGDDYGTISLDVSLPLKNFKSLVAKLEKAAEGLK